MAENINQKIIEAASKLEPLLSKVRSPEKKAADERLFSRFRPIFSREKIDALTENDFRNFTLFSENEHWSGIHRHNGKILLDFDKLKKFLKILTDEHKAIESRIDEICPWGGKKTVPGMGSSIYTAILFVLNPDKYPVYNTKTHETLKALGLYSPKDSESEATQYCRVVELSRQLANAIGCNLIELDSLYNEYLTLAPSFFKLSPGKAGDAWQEQNRNGIASIGWNSCGTLDHYDDMMVAAQKAVDADDGNDVRYIASQFKLIHDQIKEGDYILYYARGKIVGAGVVTGDYQFDPAAPRGHSRPVKILQSFKPVDITMNEKVKSLFYENNTIKEIERQSLLKAILSTIEEVNPGFNANLKITNHGSTKAIHEKNDLGNSFGGFKKSAFQLLQKYKDSPVKATFQNTKNDFEALLKKPIRSLMGSLAPAVDAILGSEIETETWITSVIQKNDYGKGGIHSHYWAAFYPTGKKRTASPQLYVILNPDEMSFGFGFGLYSKEYERRLQLRLGSASFWNQEYRDQLKALGVQIRIWDQKQENSVYKGDISEEVLREAIASTTSRPNFDVSFTSEDVDKMGSMLSSKIAEVFSALMPLYILATADSPEYYIDKWISRNLKEDEDDATFPEAQKYAWNDFLSDLNWSANCDQAILIQSVLGHKSPKNIYEGKQFILFGPPGTGKTRAALKLADHLATSKKSHIRSVQFHQSYGYEQFIEGIKPKAVNGQLTYENEEGIFVKFCRNAENRPNEQFVFVIDEINRGNISRIFGELMYLLEYRDQKMPLLYSQSPFTIPKNVTIIGTMNSADRSIALVDYALRRRFQFIEAKPQTSVLRRLYAGATNSEHEQCINFLDKLNEKIRDPRFSIGHSYFISDECKNGLTKQFVRKVWDTALYPLLQEYFLALPSRLEEFDFSGLWAEAETNSSNDKATQAA